MCKLEKFKGYGLHCVLWWVGAQTPPECKLEKLKEKFVACLENFP